MEIEWTSDALADLGRLYDFLAPTSTVTAGLTIVALVAHPRRLKDNPRLGKRLEGFEPREVRRMIVGQYEIRYEIVAKTVSILRVWHTRENR